MKLTTDQVAYIQSISPEELVDSSGVDPAEIEWTVEDVPFERLIGTYAVEPYFEEEADYMHEMQAAIDAGEIPFPAFILSDSGYRHADGAHRTVLAIHRGEKSIRAYVGRVR